MLILAHPWLLCLLPLPLLVWWLTPAHREDRQGLVVPFLERLTRDSGQRPTEGAVILRGGWLRGPSLILCWVFSLLALARPQIIEPAVTKDVPVRDLLLAVDLSGSMETKDFKNAQGQVVDRLTAVKEVLGDFLVRRQGDRVGLIFFGSAPFVQAPFTEDLKVCHQLLDEAQVKMAGPQTAFGDALGLAITVFDRSEVKERVLIALTDGNDTASKVPPVKAAQIARDKGIVIHTVAVGDPQAAGEETLDVGALKNVAATTGGLYSHAADRGQLDAIYKKLDGLETRKAQTITHRPRRDVFWWPLAAGFIISLLQQALQLLPHRQTHSVPTAPASAALTTPGIVFIPAAFHFIRPWWLLALIPAALLFWALHRRQDVTQTWRGVIAPHLLPHLLSKQDHQKRRMTPLHLIAIGWAVALVSIAGPAWRREPAPFAEDTAALAVVVKVTPSMKTEDVQPDRLTRSVQKIHDLMQERRGAKTALIAYAGSAHMVIPATKDEGIINTFAGALDPQIMPVDGDAAAEALQLASHALADAGSGSILWITDGIATEQGAPLEKWRQQSGVPVRLLPPLPDGEELNALHQAAKTVHASMIPLTPDNQDVLTLARAAKFSTATTTEMSHRWEESGYWLTPIFAILLLPFFRRGWMTPTAARA